MAAKKYYAVKKGKKTGIFGSWMIIMNNNFLKKEDKRMAMKKNKAELMRAVSELRQADYSVIATSLSMSCCISREMLMVCPESSLMAVSSDWPLSIF